MKILITGICGFVGSTLAKALAEAGHQVSGIDNLIRSGSQRNLPILRSLGISVKYGDIRNASDLETLPNCDWVVDCAANASVLAGVDGRTSSRQLVEHNLSGTINLLEYCRRTQAGFILLSTSRVYSIAPLAGLETWVEADGNRRRFTPAPLGQESPLYPVLSNQGLTEDFPTKPPVSLYGSTKLASEQLALEYGYSYDFPVWINRCGVMAGAGQFGHPAQGIFAFWIHSFRENAPLKYVGFDGQGHQVRDCLHPRDLTSLLEKQFIEPLNSQKPRILHCAGGIENSMSLAELTAWCKSRFPESTTTVEAAGTHRKFDIPWMILDASLAKKTWDWAPETTIDSICSEIASFAETQGDWLGISQDA